MEVIATFVVDEQTYKFANYIALNTINVTG